MHSCGLRTTTHQVGTASALPTTEPHSSAAGALEPDCLGSTQDHLWGQAEHAHWPGTRAVPRTAQLDAHFATVAGFLSSRLQNRASLSLPRAGAASYKRSYRGDRRASHTASLYLVGGQAVQRVKRFRRGGVQLAQVPQQGQVPKNSVMRLSAKQTGGGGERPQQAHPHFHYVDPCAPWNPQPCLSLSPGTRSGDMERGALLAGAPSGHSLGKTPDCPPSPKLHWRWKVTQD